MKEKDANVITPGTAYVPHCQGGEGSGNFDHEGRPGEVGGSGGGGSIVTEGNVKWDIGTTGLGVDTYIKAKGATHESRADKDAIFSWVTTDTFLDMQHDAIVKGGSKSSKEAFLAAASPTKIKELKSQMGSGNVFDSFAVEYDQHGKIKDFQEGRHRALAAKELGIRKLPVWFFVDKPQINDIPRKYGPPTALPGDLKRSQEKYGYENDITTSKLKKRKD